LTLSGHTDPVRSVSFSPDGLFIATASADGTAKIWDARLGAELLTLSGHSGPVNSVAYSRDGRHIVTASNDQTFRVWPAALEDYLALARNLVQRDPPLLTPTERRQYGLAETRP
jgi:WD40 repeat protein